MTISDDTPGEVIVRRSCTAAMAWGLGDAVLDGVEQPGIGDEPFGSLAVLIDDSIREEVAMHALPLREPQVRHRLPGPVERYLSAERSPGTRRDFAARPRGRQAGRARKPDAMWDAVPVVPRTVGVR
jgi:hypothetical protein